MAERRGAAAPGRRRVPAALTTWPAFSPGCGCQAGWQAFRAALVAAAREDLPAAAPLLQAAARAEPYLLAPAHLVAGRLLLRAGDPAAAERELEAGLRVTPSAALLHVSLGHALMLQGAYRRGWESMEWRRRLDFGDETWFPTLPGPEWQGETIPGTLLVRAEQGMGDCIMLARYLPAVARRVGRVVLACHGPLVRLLATMPGVAEAIPMTEPMPAFDRWILLGSVPRIFATTLETIPFPSGFLQPDAGRGEAWAARLGSGRHVGLVWAGNPAKEEDARRSLALAALRPLLAVPGFHFASLQVGPAASALAAVPGIRDLAPELTDFAETAAAVAALDLVVSVDTAVAHLAGALGRPCWLLCPTPPDWRWLLGREDSPWYASMRLFRQPRAGEWAEPIARAAAALASMR